MSKELKKENECPFPFNPVRDLAPVDQFGFVDLRDAYVNHSLPGSLALDEQQYNGVDDPSSLLGKSVDVFESYRKAQYVKQTESAAKVAEAAAKAAAASSSANE